MFDPRIYRAALLPAVAASSLMMFSLEPIPSAARGARLHARLRRRRARPGPPARSSSSRPSASPGSDGDARRRRPRPRALRGDRGRRGLHPGLRLDLRRRGRRRCENVVLTLPGASDRTILVVAPRDSAAGPGAASSAAATAQLLALAEALGGSRHERTLVLASTAGGSDGAEGARELIDALPRPEDIDAALVISQPGVARSRAALRDRLGNRPRERLRRSSSRPPARSPPSAFGERDPSPGPWVGLSRLAVPVGLGEQAALRGEGVEAIATQRRRRAPDPASEDATGRRLGGDAAAAGAATLDLILTLDEAERAPERRARRLRAPRRQPDPRLDARAAGAHAPAPAAPRRRRHLAARAARRLARRAAPLPWALERALLPLAALLLAYLLGLVGLVPDPPFPYDPGRFPPGPRRRSRSSRSSAPASSPAC